MAISPKADPSFSIPYSELISILGEIQSKTKSQQFYYVDEIPTILKPYIDTFLYGKTIGAKDGRKFIYYNDIMQWLRKVWQFGLSSSVQ